MIPGTLRALEFDRIVQVVRTFALTPLGARRAAVLRPATEVSRVMEALALTREVVAFHDEAGGFPLRANEELDQAVGALGIAGRAVEPQRLIALADFLDSTGRTRRLVLEREQGRWPNLRPLAEALISFAAEVAAVRRAIGPSGDVLDEASDLLRKIRARLRRQRQHLRTTLDAYVRGRETARYLQEPVVTERNGRFVLMVKAEHRNAIAGLVHGASASGATLFLEPLASSEINNDIAALEDQEAEEVQRILRELSDRFRARGSDLQHTLGAAAALDLAQAKARFSQRVNGVEPMLAPDGRLELRGARHPLLMAAVRRRLEDGAAEAAPYLSAGQEAAEAALTAGNGGRAPLHGRQAPQPSPEPEPVPVDLLVIPPTRVLVITGPNTGGKTVALKTAGLLPLMAQAGLLVPAEEGTALPVFQSVFADIGDEQSIAANLSTFSGHVTNIAAMDRALALPGLVLLDELGAGTDPVDGGALGVAIVDHFRMRGALVIVTTHHDQLKSYAMTTEDVTAAAFGFEPETFAPTYRLLYGSPGASLALEIATRLGLDPAIVDRARKQRTGEQAQLADRLARMDRDLQALDQEQRLARRTREQAEAELAAARGREAAIREREAQLRRRLEATLNERLREARGEIDRVVADLKAKAAQLETDARRRAAPRLVAVTTGELGGLRSSARARLEELSIRARRGGEPRVTTEGTDALEDSRPTRVGDRVVVEPLGVEGTVQSLSRGAAEVDVKGKRLRAPLGDLRLVSSAAHQPGRVARDGRARAPGDEADRSGGGHVTVTLESPETASSELNVIGCTVNEALDRADKFLDQAIVADTRVVRVIHGHGTGRLREALGAFLREHPLVTRFGAAADEQGGKAVTVVELKE
jgi:DNA mismatch repair protein MutS2